MQDRAVVLDGAAHVAKGACTPCACTRVDDVHACTGWGAWAKCPHPHAHGPSAHGACWAPHRHVDAVDGGLVVSEVNANGDLLHLA